MEAGLKQAKGWLPGGFGKISRGLQELAQGSVPDHSVARPLLMARRTSSWALPTCSLSLISVR